MIKKQTDTIVLSVYFSKIITTNFPRISKTFTNLIRIFRYVHIYDADGLFLNRDLSNYTDRAMSIFVKYALEGTSIIVITASENHFVDDFVSVRVVARAAVGLGIRYFRRRNTANTRARRTVSSLG